MRTVAYAAGCSFPVPRKQRDWIAHWRNVCCNEPLRSRTLKLKLVCLLPSKHFPLFLISRGASATSASNSLLVFFEFFVSLPVFSFSFLAPLFIQMFIVTHRGNFVRTSDSGNEQVAFFSVCNGICKKSLVVSAIEAYFACLAPADALLRVRRVLLSVYVCWNA